MGWTWARRADVRWYMVHTLAMVADFALLDAEALKHEPARCCHRKKMSNLAILFVITYMLSDLCRTWWVVTALCLCLRQNDGGSKTRPGAPKSGASTPRQKPKRPRTATIRSVVVTRTSSFGTFATPSSWPSCFRKGTSLAKIPVRERNFGWNLLTHSTKRLRSYHSAHKHNAAQENFEKGG
jgi:hypothetical protein